MKSIFALSLFSVFIWLNECTVNRESVNKFWAVTCRNFDCDQAFLHCIDNRCNGVDQCKRCIVNDYPRCSRCVDELFDERETIDGQLLCDPEDSLQVDGCRFYCRANFLPYGECVYENFIPVCKCSRTTPAPGSV